MGREWGGVEEDWMREREESRGVDGKLFCLVQDLR